jgi:hypothetical protein
MPEAALLVLTLLFAICGMAWFALAIDTHWAQLQGPSPLKSATARKLRLMGTVSLAASLTCCLLAEHASMAALVWAMLLTVAAYIVTFTLAWRPRWLALFLLGTR